MENAIRLRDIMLAKGWVFYHFTDETNLPSIQNHGLLSMHEMRRLGIGMVPGGNEWSLDADKRSGMDRYVHLCFFEEHPMEYIAKKEGRISRTRFLRIDPNVLTIEGALITKEVANKAGVQPRPASEMVEELDLEVIYTRTDWKDPKVQVRLREARKNELLVPAHIPTELIRNLR